MPNGAGLSYNHTKLTEVIGEFVALRKVGDIFTSEDITEYISKLPIKKFARVTGAGGVGKTVEFQGRISKKSQIEKSEPYFTTILRTNAVKWNLRYGRYFGHCGIREIKGKDGYIVSHVKTLHTVIYCKTDNLGSFSCVLCETKVTLKPQWAYVSSKPKTIRRDIHCPNCYDRYEIMKFDHSFDKIGSRKKRSGIGGAVVWKIKDRFRHWTGEEE